MNYHTASSTLTRPAWRAPAAAATSRCSNCFVRKISICAALDAQELDALMAIARHVEVQDGEEIIAQGAPMDAVWNITSGMVRLTRLLPDGRRQIAGFMLPGDFLGLPLSATSTYAAEAIGEVRLCRFERGRFESLMRNYPHLMRRLLDAACAELARDQDHMVSLARHGAQEKIAAFLLSLRNRRRALGCDDGYVALAMTRQDIADHLGLTIETVSRVLTRLSKAGLIRIERHGVRLLSAAPLEDLALGASET
jgi:CRP/FNR family transcriptional regulator